MKGIVAILCHNSCVLTRRAIRSVQRQTIPVKILVMDNASTDNTNAVIRAMQSADQNIWIHNLYQQISVAAAWNRIFDWAAAKGYEEVLALNNDAEILPETCQILSNYAESSGAGMVTCISRRPGEDLGFTLGDWHERPHPDFSCYLMRVKAYRMAGKFDEQFEGAYYEDNDYHIRMHQAGVRAVCIDLPFLHHGAATLNNADEKEATAIRQHAAMNKERFFEKWGCYPGTLEYDEYFK